MKNKKTKNKQISTPFKFLVFVACCGFFGVVVSFFNIGAFNLFFSLLFGGISYYIIKKKYLEKPREITKKSPDKQLNQVKVYDYILKE